MKKSFRSSSLRPLLVSIVAILFGFLVGSILLIASGQNPIQCFIALFKGGLSSKEENIILSHMWPLARRRPRSAEAAVVNLADKLCATAEVLGYWRRSRVREKAMG